MSVVRLSSFLSCSLNVDAACRLYTARHTQAYATGQFRRTRTLNDRIHRLLKLLPVESDDRKTRVGAQQRAADDGDRTAQVHALGI